MMFLKKEFLIFFLFKSTHQIQIQIYKIIIITLIHEGSKVWLSVNK